MTRRVTRVRNMTLSDTPRFLTRRVPICDSWGIVKYHGPGNSTKLLISRSASCLPSIGEPVWLYLRSFSQLGQLWCQLLLVVVICPKLTVRTEKTRLVRCTYVSDTGPQMIPGPQISRTANDPGPQMILIKKYGMAWTVE